MEAESNPRKPARLGLNLRSLLLAFCALATYGLFYWRFKDSIPKPDSAP